MASVKDKVAEWLGLAGVKVNGSRPWDIKVHDERFYGRVISGGSLALGESYMDGWWDAERLDQCVARILSARLEKRAKRRDLIGIWVKSRVLNLQRRTRAFEVGERHYDLGNELYGATLDKSLTYTCGYWKSAKTLDEAQEAKLELVCRKLELKKGMRVLDIGSGWGSFAKYAAEKYKVKIVGVTVSKEQVEFSKRLCKNLPVEIRLQDYRDIKGEFDRVVSLGMFEHVGYKNYREYMEIVSRCLKEKGLFLLHTIGGNVSVKSCDPWMDKYIFPNAMLPSVRQIAAAAEGLFVMEDWHSFGADYDKTLMAWWRNFERNWEFLKKKYDERFYRMWRYYLLTCAASFRVRKNQLWQIVFSKGGVPGGYVSLR